jgi:hypothetical protein
MKFAIISMMQYDINMKSSEDCAKIKSDWVQTIISNHSNEIITKCCKNGHIIRKSRRL